MCLPDLGFLTCGLVAEVAIPDDAIFPCEVAEGHAPTFVILLPELSIPVVHRELSSLDISKRAAPDAIHSKVVPWLADFLADPLV